MTAQEAFEKHTEVADDLLALSSQIAVLTGLLSAESVVESMSAHVDRKSVV